MARYPSPQKLHRPKDLCTIEQAEAIALRVATAQVRSYHAQCLASHPWRTRWFQFWHQHEWLTSAGGRPDGWQGSVTGTFWFRFCPVCRKRQHSMTEPRMVA